MHDAQHQAHDDHHMVIVAVSSLDPVQLTGACAAKLDNAVDQAVIKAVTDALARRLDK